MRNRLALAIAAFLILDLGVLLFSFSITQQVNGDALAINLAGRQRMISQRLTKAALLATDERRSASQRRESDEELIQSYRLFRRTLVAFAQGGTTQGSDGEEVFLENVTGRAALLVGKVQGALDTWPQPPDNPTETASFARFMVEHNREILDTMNELTTTLETQSTVAVHNLRVAQTLAFFLSVINFLGITYSLHRARVRAEMLSERDAMTGLLNRGGFYAALRGAMAQREAGRQPLGVLLLDMDGFKAVNDTFGHAVGDKTLKEVARRLKGLEAEGHGWICGRLGGDEFAILCPDLDARQIEEAGRYVSTVLSGVPGGSLTLSASVGWACVDFEQPADAAIAAADAMMYDAKRRSGAPRSHRDHLRWDDGAGDGAGLRLILDKTDVLSKIRP